MNILADNKKINIRVDADVQNSIAQNSKRLGITMSQYFRNIIESIDSYEGLKIDQNKSKNFCVFMDEKMLRKLDDMAKALNTSRNQLINFFLRDKLMNYLSEYDEQIEDSTQKIKHPSIEENKQANFHELSLKSLIDKIQINFAKGNLVDMNLLFDLAKSKDINNAYNWELSYIQACNFYCQGKIKESSVIIEDLLYMMKNKDLLLYARSLYLKAVIEYNKQNFKNSYKLTMKALKYFETMKNVEFDLVECWFNLSSLELKEGKVQNAEIFLFRSKYLIDKLNDSDLRSKFYKYYSRLLIYKKSNINVINFINMSKKLAKENGSNFELYHINGDIAGYYLNSRNYDYAYSYALKSIEYQNTFRSLNIGISDLYLNFIASRDRYLEAKENIIGIRRKRCEIGLDTEYSDYVLYSTMYIFGDYKDQEESYIKLNKMLEFSTNSLKTSILNTFRTNNLSIFV